MHFTIRNQHTPRVRYKCDYLFCTPQVTKYEVRGIMYLVLSNCKRYSKDTTYAVILCTTIPEKKSEDFGLRQRDH